MPGSSQHMCLRLHRFPSINNNAWSAIVARPLCIPAGFQLSSAATRAAFALVSLLCLLLRRRRCLCFALGLSLCAATFWEISLIFSWKPGLLCVAGRVKDTHTHTHTHAECTADKDTEAEAKAGPGKGRVTAEGGIMADRYLLRRSCSECASPSEFLALSRRRTCAQCTKP